MPRFIMQIQLSPGRENTSHSVIEQGEQIDERLRQLAPQFIRSERFVVLNHCDLVDVIEAPDFETAERAATIVEGLGHHVIEVMSATPWDRFVELTRDRDERTRDRPFDATASRLIDRVQESSEGSFPASDAPGWTGIIAR